MPQFIRVDNIIMYLCIERSRVMEIVCTFEIRMHVEKMFLVN